jgi:diguanylate cyclase (GGDEF)-like protein
MKSELLRLMRPFLAPAAILVAAPLLLAVGRQLPESFSALRDFWPYLVLPLGAVVSLWFNRGRVFVAAMSLLIAYAGYQYALSFGDTSFPFRAVFAAIAIFVPGNILLALLLPERGVAHQHDYRWLLLAAAEILLALWIASAGRNPLSGDAWKQLLEHGLLHAPPTPWLARIVFLAAVSVAAWRLAPQHGGSQAPLEVGKAGSLVAFFIACENVASPAAFAAFVSAAGAILLVAVLQESHRLAFRDELTGLPGRRALQEALAGLGTAYTVAMIDIDHFKKFNDTHGHDVGDQVLKLVAARLAEVGGGGRAFRYGGEEFAVLFAARAPDEAQPHLEAIRAAIESYRMAVRGEDRPRQSEEGEKRRGAGALEKTLSVTVSIGLAGTDERQRSPAEVVKAADRALYRAKQAGRNRVER